MVDLCPKQVEDLRNDIKDRYGLEINAKITRVEFEEQGRNRVYFRAEDGYKPPKPEELPKSVYKVLIWERKLDEEPSEMRFKALETAMIAFRNQQHLNFAKIVLLEDSTVLQTYRGH